MASKLMFWTKIYLTNQFWCYKNEKENIKLIFSKRKAIVVAQRILKRVLDLKVSKKVSLRKIKKWTDKTKDPKREDCKCNTSNEGRKRKLKRKKSVR